MAWLGAHGLFSATAAVLPLSPELLAGTDVFLSTEKHVTAAAQAADLSFVPDSRPLPPMVVVPVDTKTKAVQKRNGMLVWRGDMQPDQMAPGERGMLLRKRRTADGSWELFRTREPVAYDDLARFSLAPVSLRAGERLLPPVVIETPYLLGRMDDSPVVLQLWRSPEEGSAPIAGFLLVPDSFPRVSALLMEAFPPFEDSEAWRRLFDAFSPPPPVRD
jgi:hypothetical protein